MTTLLIFPNIQAKDLDGRAVETRSLRGAPAVVTLGFTYESRNEVEPWSRFIKEATQGRLRVIEMPVYTGMARMMRGVIDGSMARRTPKAAHADVWTTEDYDGLVQGLKLEAPEKQAAIVLLDGSGQVRWVGRGKPTPSAQQAFLTAWKALDAGR